jgi:hypothetical protein
MTVVPADRGGDLAAIGATDETNMGHMVISDVLALVDIQVRAQAVESEAVATLLRLKVVSAEGERAKKVVARKEPCTLRFDAPTLGRVACRVAGVRVTLARLVVPLDKLRGKQLALTAAAPFDADHTPGRVCTSQLCAVACWRS